ncbi:MAG: uncharacterized protein QOD93_2925 [Acetobacteraceae bacterium]|jgi:uncharacterized protein|nr:hypothetical protein [Rhodopila sp.]MEA2769963.1 uncharacterized protein [Acetobacteraceae bacterium]
MRVEWDDPERISDLEDHGMDFKDAVLIFEGVLLEAEDKRSDYGEPRYRALGRVGDDSFMVAFRWRGEARRIVSAWRVDDDGKRRYEAILNRKP